MTARRTATYDFHGHAIAVTGWPSVLEQVDARLRPFRAPAPAGGAIDIHFERERPDSPQWSRTHSSWRCIYDADGARVLFDAARDVVWIEVNGELRAECVAADGRAVICAPDPAAEWLGAHPLLTIVLMETLKRRGVYALHAGAVAVGGRAILVAGPSGSGKSTLSVALAREGCELLGDDTVFVAREGDGWRILAFPDQVDLCADAFRFFPELAAQARPPSDGARKHQVTCANVYGATLAAGARPAVLVFPSPTGRPDTVLTPIGAHEALIGVAPNVLLTERDASQRHFDALAGLISQCGAYRLETGLDVAGAAIALRGLV